MPTPLEDRKRRTFSSWLGTAPDNIIKDEVKTASAYAGYQAGWDAALHEVAWVQRFLLHDLREPALEGRRTGRWAYPLDVIALRCEAAAHEMRSDGWPTPPEDAL